MARPASSRGARARDSAASSRAVRQNGVDPQSRDHLNAADWRLFFTRAREGGVCALAQTFTVNKSHPPPTVPRGIPSVPSSKLGKRTPHSAPERRPDADTSAMPPGSRCLRPCKPAVLSAVSACRRFPDQRSPPAALVQTPNAFQPVCRFTKTQFRGVPPRSAEVPPLFRFR